MNVQNHPVIKRLFQFRQLLLNLEPVFEEVVKPQIELILAEDSDANQSIQVVEKKKKTLKLLASLTKKMEEKNTKKTKNKLNSVNEDDKPPEKKVKFADGGTDEMLGENKEDKLTEISDQSESEEETAEEKAVEKDGKKGRTESYRNWG